MLNREIGEHVEGLGLGFVVAPIYHWSDTPYWGIACKKAKEQFAKAGALIVPEFSADDVSVQVYDSLPKPITDQRGNVFTDALVFLFNKPAPISVWKRTEPGAVKKDLIARVVIGLTPQQKAELVMAGRWSRKTVN